MSTADLDRPATSLVVEVDAASKLPSLASIAHDARTMLSTNGYLGVIVLDLEPLSPIEQECGAAVYNQLLGRVAAELTQMRQQVIRNSDLVCCIHPFGEQLAIFLDAARTPGTFDESTIEKVADRVWVAMSGRVAELTRPFGGRGRLRLGYALALPNTMIQAERIIYRAITQAARMAVDHSHRMDTRTKERLRDLITHRQLRTVFQPMVEGRGRSVQAYEALIRGPEGTELANPAMLFGLAAHAGLVTELDRACAAVTLDAARNMPGEALLFANVVPTLINDPSFRRWLLERSLHLGPRRIVLEINEGTAIRNHDVLSDGIAELRRAGIRIAVDDLGAGYANLDYVLRLRPDFLKLDISLVRGVHENPIKQALISSMVTVGRAVEATVIAEGIEDRADYEALLGLGVQWMQGYYFARPAPGFPVPTQPTPERPS